MTQTQRRTLMSMTLLLVVTSAFPQPLWATNFIEVNFNWTAPVDGSPVAHYVVQHSTNGGPFSPSTAVPQTNCLLPVEIGDDHQIRVAGVDDQNRQGPWSLTSEIYEPEILTDTPPEYTNGFVGLLTIIDGGVPAITGEAYIDSIRVVEWHAGGDLAGDIHILAAKLIWNATGVGAYEGFEKQVNIPLSGEIHTAPRARNDPLQNFATNVFRLHGELSGDSDFGEFSFRTGMDFDLPSAGQTTLSSQQDGTYTIDSFMDINYHMDYQGHAGSLLAGLSGFTVKTESFVAGKTRSTSNDSVPAPPAVMALHQNAPNPFNPRTVIRYELAQESSHVGLEIYDIRGHQVRALVNETQWAGLKTVSWSGEDNRGQQVPAGIYFYKLTTGQGTLIRKMALVK